MQNKCLWPPLPMTNTSPFLDVAVDHPESSPKNFPTSTVPCCHHSVLFRVCGLVTSSVIGELATVVVGLLVTVTVTVQISARHSMMSRLPTDAIITATRDSSNYL